MIACYDEKGWDCRGTLDFVHCPYEEVLDAVKSRLSSKLDVRADFA